MYRSGKAEPTPPECALAAEMFDHFCSAATMKQALALHREICNTLNLKPNRLPDFYPKLKMKLTSSWKAQALFKKFDVRASHKVYAKGHVAAHSKVLIIGAGPCGLRAAIECQLLGAKVVIVEKRDRISRNNVLHLWPFVIHDLKALGAKKFFGKFCAGAIDHISIRQLQCILLKAVLLLGAEFHEGVSFEELLEPSVMENSETLGWRARVHPADHPVSQYEFDALIGADGKRNTLHGFKRNEFRGKLAMAITANFINRHSEQEAAVPEISGIAFIFKQKFFKDLYENTKIDLENIVYYKDDTHYFVMTAKKHSLLEKGVLLTDYPEVSRLLSLENVDRDALLRYAQEAARFSTNGRLPLNDFALNHYGEPDVALFDFTSMYAAENASMVYERLGRRLLCQLVGDSLLEPFWPTGSGCARGFLSALDAAWAIRSWGLNPAPHPLQIIAERESIYRLLAQTTPENLQRDFGAYTLDPATRYPNLNRTAVTPSRVTAFYDSDDPLPLDATTARKRRREVEISDEALMMWVDSGLGSIDNAVSAASLSALVRRYRPDLLPPGVPPVTVYSVLHTELGIQPFSICGQTRHVPESKLRSYLNRVYLAFKGEVPHIHHESDVFDQIKKSQQKENTDHSLAKFTHAAEAEASHSSYRKKRRGVLTSQEEGKAVGGRTRQAGCGARVAKLAAELAGTTSSSTDRPNKPKDLMRSVGKIERDDWNVKEIERKIKENQLGRPEPKTAEKVPKWDREQFLGRQQRLLEKDANEDKWVEIDETLNKINQKLTDAGRPDPGTKKVANLATKFVKKDENNSAKALPQLKEKEEKKRWGGVSSAKKECAACGMRVFAAEGVIADGLHLHRSCFKCAVCKAVLRPGNYTTLDQSASQLICLRHTNKEKGLLSANALATSSRPSISTPERISLEVSDSCAKEIDEDEWTDRNFLASETSGAGGLSDDDDTSSDEYTDAAASDDEPYASPQPLGLHMRHTSDMYISDDSFPYDDSSDGADSTESCSRMRAALEARRREVPADAPPPSDSSEVEDADSESSEDVSSGTEVSTDSEFARDECPPAPPPPAILVTEPSPAPSVPRHDYPLARIGSAGGLATKRALELKRKYLLGEPSPPAVRRSESTSHIDNTLAAFRSNISEFQKLLHPAPVPSTVQPLRPFDSFLKDERTQPMPDIIQNIRQDAPVDLLTLDAPVVKKDMYKKPSEREKQDGKRDPDLDTDSLSEGSRSPSKSALNQSVPRVEVHDEGGELIQLDSLTLLNSCEEDNDEKASRASGSATATGPTVVAAESESSESCRDVTTLALTETELSDWAAESAVLEDCNLDEKDEQKRNRNPRTLSGPKSVHDSKNLSSLSSHVCGRSSPEQAIVYSNAPEHFEFADEGEQDPSIETPRALQNAGYLEFVDDEFDPYSVNNDRSMNFIESSFSETMVKATDQGLVSVPPTEICSVTADTGSPDAKTDTGSKSENDLKSPQLLKSIDNKSSETSSTSSSSRLILMYAKDVKKLNEDITSVDDQIKSIDLSDTSSSPSKPTPETNQKQDAVKYSNGSAKNVDISPEASATNSYKIPVVNRASTPSTIRLYSPAICRSASENFNRSSSHSSDSPSRSLNLTLSINLSSGSLSSISLPPQKESLARQINKVQELKKEREEQTEVVRLLVLERLGSGPRVNRKSTRRSRVLTPTSNVPPPVPPPPVMLSTPPPPPPPPPPLLITPPPSRPTPPQMHLPVVPSFSDPELARARRRRNIMKSISNYLNRRLGPRTKESTEQLNKCSSAHKSTGALQEAPPVPPPPAGYHPSPAPPPISQTASALGGCSGDADERDAMQLWFEARWARLMAQRRGRDHADRNGDEPASRRLARLERRLSRPLSAEQQAATVAELVQVSAQRDAHQALMAADKRRTATSLGKNPA